MDEFPSLFQHGCLDPTLRAIDGQRRCAAPDELVVYRQNSYPVRLFLLCSDLVVDIVRVHHSKTVLDQGRDDVSTKNAKSPSHGPR